MEIGQLRVADELDDGGQAKVFALADDANLVLKRYHDPDHLGLQPGTLHTLIGLRHELRAMGWAVDSWAAWPIEPVEDRGRLVGFLMPRVTGEFMLVVGGKARLANLSYLAQEPRPIWGDVDLPTQEGRLRVLVSLAGIMQALHDRDLVIGDLSFGNVLWTAGPPARVFLLDCDGIRPANGLPVLPQADTLDWADLLARRGTPPDKDRDRYKLALAILRVLSRSLEAYPTTDTDHDLRDTPAEAAVSLNALLKRAAGPIGTRPSAGEWRLALEGRRAVGVVPPTVRPATSGPPPKPELLVSKRTERQWRDV